MSLVRDVIRKKGGEVFMIPPDATVLEALRTMAEHNTGVLMVASGKKVGGILSERDCVRKMDLAGRTAKDTKVADIMTSKVVYVEASPLKNVWP
jgi:CBS domain-containing protein